MKLTSLPVLILKLLPKGLIKPIAFKYVAGEDMQAAITHTRELNDAGFTATLDILGESARSLAEAEGYTLQYVELMDEIARNKIRSGVSVKPTAIGLCLGYDVALKNFRVLVDAAKKHSSFIRIDMEDSPYTDDTIRLYQDLQKDYDRVGIVFQAYLKRTRNDISAMAEKTLNVRICKGIYNEPAEIAYKRYEEINDSYIENLRLAFSQKAYVGIATHDEKLVERAKTVIDEMNVKPGQYEFQMLYGVLPNLRAKILAEGHPLRVYVPYGKDWYPYSIRRMYENPMIAFYVARAVFVDSFVYLFRLVFRPGADQ